MLKSAAVLLPPLSLTTCFFTKRWAGWSSLVMVQLFCSPAAIVPAQPAESVGEYPSMSALSETEYVPAFSVTVVPASLPGNEAGLGAPPATFIVQLSADALPPLSLMTCLITISIPVAGGKSSFVIVQILVSLTAIVPLQSGERVLLYPVTGASSTL